MNINWQNLCYKMGHTTFRSETDVEDTFSQILDLLFGWHEFEKRLKRQVPVPVGRGTKYADIVLYHDRNCFVIEMKGPGVEPNGHYVDQLKSYMKLLSSEYGLIVNDKKIWLYYSRLGSTAINEVAVIPFSPDRQDGEEFASLITYDAFDIQRLDAFREEKYQEYLKEQKADKLLNMLCDGENGRAIVRQAIMSDESLLSEYGRDVILIALGKLKLTLEKGGSVLPPPPPPPPPPPEKHTTFTGFVKKGLQNGTIVHFKGDPSITAEVCGDKELLFENKVYTLSGLAKMLYIRIGKITPSGAYQGAMHFLYNGIPVLKLPDKE